MINIFERDTSLAKRQDFYNHYKFSYEESNIYRKMMYPNLVYPYILQLTCPYKLLANRLISF